MSRIPIESLANGVLLTTVPFVSPQNPTGAAVLTPGAGRLVQVYAHGTTTPATVFVQEVAGTTLALPLTTGVDGSVPGWIDPTTLPLDLVVNGVTYVLAGGGGSGGVATFNTRSGAVTLAKADVTGTGLAAADVGADVSGAAATEQTRALAAEALLAPLASPALTGNPTVPTQTALTNSTRAASTAYTDAAVGVETARATTAEGLLIPLSQKGAASGVMALDGSGNGAQPPKAHAQSLHGRGGTDTFLNGLEISDTSAQQTNHAFIFGPRTSTGFTFAVPTVQAKAAQVTALDIAPGVGAPTKSTNNGWSWVDVCDLAVIDAVTWNATSTRVGNGATVSGVEVGDLSTRKFGSASAKDLVICADWDGSSNPQIFMKAFTNGTPYIRLGFDGSDVLQGTASVLATGATKGFMFVATVAGTPTGVPVHAGAAATALVYDTTGHKIWVFDQPANAWKGVAVA